MSNNKNSEGSSIIKSILFGPLSTRPIRGYSPLPTPLLLILGVSVNHIELFSHSTFIHSGYSQYSY